MVCVEPPRSAEPPKTWNLEQSAAMAPRCPASPGAWCRSEGGKRVLPILRQLAPSRFGPIPLLPRECLFVISARLLPILFSDLSPGLAEVREPPVAPGAQPRPSQVQLGRRTLRRPKATRGLRGVPVVRTSVADVGARQDEDGRVSRAASSRAEVNLQIVPIDRARAPIGLKRFPTSSVKHLLRPIRQIEF